MGIVLICSDQFAEINELHKVASCWKHIKRNTILCVWHHVISVLTDNVLQCICGAVLNNLS